MTLQNRWPLIRGGLFGRFDCNDIIKNGWDTFPDKRFIYSIKAQRANMADLGAAFLVSLG